jgi:hypothetical protein
MTPAQTHPGAVDGALLNLVYCSRAAPGIDDAAVDRILVTARCANPALGITGLLVYGRELFFQWLEGPPPAVQGLMQRLAADPRHHSLVVLSQSEEVRDRLFPDWSMERVDTESIRDVLHDALGEPHDAATLATLQAMLDGLDANGL